MSTLARVARNISWNYVQAGVGLVTYFLVTPVVVEGLGTVGFGMWVLLNAILFYLKFLDLGFYNALVKYVAEHSAREDWPLVNALVGTTVGVLACAGAVAFLGACGVAWLLVPHAFDVPPESVRTLQVATLVIGFDLLLAFPASALGAVVEGRQRFDVGSAIAVPLSIIGAVATVAIVKGGGTIIDLAWLMVAITVLDTGATLWALRRICPELRISAAFDAARRRWGEMIARIRGYSTWTSMNEVLAEGSAELEKLLVPIFLSVSLLTPYSLIVTVCAAVFLVVEPITDVFFPLSAAYDTREDAGKLRAILVRGTKLVVGVSLPIAVAVAFHGEDFILFWIGEDVVDVPAGVLPLVVTSFAITALVLTSTTVLLAIGRVREVFWMGIVELVIALALVVATVPRYELRGLAGSLLVSNALVSLFWVVPAVCRQLSLPVNRLVGPAVLRPLLAAVPMAGALVLLRSAFPVESLPGIAANCVAAGAVYLAAFWFLSLTSQERAMAWGTVRAMMPRLFPD